MGLTNVRRNLGRTIMAMTSVALAVIIITSIASLADGYPAIGFTAGRAFAGGDVIVYASPHLAPPATLASNGGDVPAEAWRLGTLSRDQPCDLVHLHPELYTQGFLAPGGRPAAPIDVAALEALLGENPNVTGVSPSFFLPIRAEFFDPVGGRAVNWNQFVLRGRDFGFASPAGHWSFEQLLTKGRLPGPEEADLPLIVLDERLRTLGHRPLPEPGDEISLFVPAVTVAPDGAWRFDYTRESEYRVAVAGHYATLTNYVAWEAIMGMPQYEDLYWVTPQLQAPIGFFREVFAAASGGQLPRHALQVGLTVTPFTQVENIAAELGTMLPGHTVVSAPRQLTLAQSRGLPEATLLAPLGRLGKPSAQQIGLPLDLSRVFMVLAALLAAMLLTSNLLFLVARRRREIGVLKTLGARRGDIVTMVLTEALTLSLLGTVAGFSLTRVFVTWTMFTNKIPWATIGWVALRDFLVVAGVALAVATVCGLLPAWRMASLTSMEVLRDE